VPLHYFEAHNGLWYLATRTEDGWLEWATMPIEPVAADTPIAERDVPRFIRREAYTDNKMTDRTIYRVPEVLKILRIGRTKFYRMVQTGEIVIHKLGGSTIVKQESLDRVFATLPTPQRAPRLGGGCGEPDANKSELARTSIQK